jgi:hypothetical protein
MTIPDFGAGKTTKFCFSHRPQGLPLGRKIVPIFWPVGKTSVFSGEVFSVKLKKKQSKQVVLNFETRFLQYIAIIYFIAIK